MNIIKLAAFGGAALALSSASALAFPAAPASGPAPLVQTVAEGCGPGFFRGPRGVCRPMGGRRVQTCVTRRTPRGVVRTCRS